MYPGNRGIPVFGTPTVVMSVQQARNHVLAMHRQGQTYAMLDAGWRYLAAVASDPEIVTLVLQGLLDIGLGGVARELLQARKDLDRRDVQKWQAQTGAPAQRVQPPAVGRVPWVDLRETYQSNVALLLEHQPHLAGIEKNLEDALRGVHLYQTSDGHFLLSCRRPGQYRQWLPGITDYAHDLKFKLPGLPHGTPLFIDGISLGPMVVGVHEATAVIGINQSLPMFLVDEDLAHLAAWLHVKDQSKLLGDDRVWVFCGPKSLELLERCLTEEEDLGVAPACVITPPGFKSLKDELMALQERVLRRRRDTFQRILEQLEKRYAQRDYAYWQRRLQARGPIMAMTSRATTMLQYSTRDIGHAFEELGYEFHLLIESADHRQLTNLQIAKKILQVDPILFVMLDHLRYEQNGLIHSIPALTWIQDPLPNILCERAGASIGALDFVCGYYRDRCVKEFGYPELQFIVAPFPVSTRTFHDGLVPGLDRNKLECDVVYVGHMQATVSSHYQQWQSKNPPALRPVLDVIYQRVQEVLERGEHINEPAPFLRHILDELGVSLEDQVFESMAYWYAHRLFDLGFRQQTLKWVGDWAERMGRCFKIYGKNWQNHPELAKYAAGPIEHGEPLRRVYRSARLVLQTIPGGFLHQRTHEALASGSLVVVRYSPSDFFKLPVEECLHRIEAGEELDCTAFDFPGVERVVFRSAKEFEVLAELYLSDEAARREVLADLRAVVLTRYTYTSVLSRIMAEIKQRLAESVMAGAI